MIQDMHISTFLTVNLSLYLVGFWGIMVMQKNLLVTIISLELLLLSASLMFVIYGINLDDITGELMSFFILVIAGSETAIILAILIAYYRRSNNIFVARVPVKG